MQKYYFGLMLLMKPEWTSGFMVRNVLCRAASELTNYSLEQKAMGIDVSRQKNVTAPPTQIAEQCHALNEEALGLSFWGRERVTQLDGRTEIIRELSGNSECSSIDATQSFVLDASGSLVSSQITPTNGLSAGLLNVLKAHCTRPWKWLEPVDVMHSCN